MTPQEVFNIAREFDAYTITGARDGYSSYQSMMLQFHERQVVTLRVNDDGHIAVNVFNEDRQYTTQIYNGDDALWLAAVLSKIQSTNPMELT